MAWAWRRGSSRWKWRAGRGGGATAALRRRHAHRRRLVRSAEVRDLLDRHGLEISSLAYYPNNLHPDDRHREEVNGHLRKVVDAAAALGVEVVGTSVGNDKDRPLVENLERFRRSGPSSSVTPVARA